MSNQNYSAMPERKVNAAKGGKVAVRKGEMGAEHDAAHKDTVTAWPKTGNEGTGQKSCGFPVIKTVVVSRGSLSGGNGNHYK